MANKSLQSQHEGIKALSGTVRRAYVHAKSLGYTGTSLEYSMMVLPPDMNLEDAGGYKGPLSGAPSISELLSQY